MKPIKTISYRGCSIKIYSDEDPLNPREDNENLGKMACFHRRYSLGDKEETGRWSSPQEFLEFLDQENPPVAINLYLLDHSGLSMWARRGFEDCDPQGWDWECVGIIYA